MSRFDTCVKGDVHPMGVRWVQVKPGYATVKQPCPLYMQKLSMVDVESGEKDSIICSWPEDISEKPASGQEGNETQSVCISIVWATVLACLVAGLLTTLVIFTSMLRHDAFSNRSQGIPTPPQVAPGVIPGPGQTVYEALDGSLMVCGHAQDQYTCHTVDPDA